MHTKSQEELQGEDSSFLPSLCCFSKLAQARSLPAPSLTFQQECRLWLPCRHERRGILWRWRGPSGLRWVWRNGRGPHLEGTPSISKNPGPGSPHACTVCSSTLPPPQPLCRQAAGSALCSGSLSIKGPVARPARLTGSRRMPGPMCRGDSLGESGMQT